MSSSCVSDEIIMDYCAISHFVHSLESADIGSSLKGCHKRSFRQWDLMLTVLWEMSKTGLDHTKYFCEDGTAGSSGLLSLSYKRKIYFSV